MVMCQLHRWHQFRICLALNSGVLEVRSSGQPRDRSEINGKGGQTFVDLRERLEIGGAEEREKVLCSAKAVSSGTVGVVLLPDKAKVI